MSDLKPGIYKQSASEYHADSLCPTPSLSSSIAAKLIGRSPAHARLAHPKLGGVNEESTKAMDFGSVCHEMFWGVGEGIEIIRGCDNFKTKAAQESRDSAISEGKIPILAKDYKRAVEAVENWGRQLVTFGLSALESKHTGEREMVIVWQEDNGVWCRAMIDIFARPEIWDLKTTHDSSPKAIQRKIVNDQLDLRSEFYKRGVQKLGLCDDPKFGFLFCETEEPFSVTPVKNLDGQFRMIGQRKVEDAIRIWGECLKSGTWPHYVSEAVSMECPKYLWRDEIEEDGK